MVHNALVITNTKMENSKFPFEVLKPVNSNFGVSTDG